MSISHYHPVHSRILSSSRWFFPILLVFGLLLAEVASLTQLGRAAQVIAGCLLGVGIVAAWRSPARDSRFDLWAAGLSMMLHFASVVYAIPIVRAHYGLSGDDTAMYYNLAKGIAASLVAGPTGVEQLLASTMKFSTAAFSQLWGVLYLFTGGSYTAIAVLFAWLGTVGSYWFIKAFEPFLAPRYWRWYVLLTMAMPSILFWTSWPLKDTVTYSTLGLLTYGLSLILRGRTWTGLTSISVGGALCFVVRPYFGFFYGVPLLVSMGWYGTTTLRAGGVKRISGTLFVSAMAAVLLWYVVSNNFFLGIQLGPKGIAWLQRYQAGAGSGGSALPSPTLGTPVPAAAAGAPLLSGAERIIQFLVVRVSYLFDVLFRPMPWEARSLFALLTSIENVTLLFLTIGILWSLNTIMREIARTPLLLFSALLAVLFALVFSLQVVNLGSMVRLKVNLLPFLLPFTCFAIERTWAGIIGRSGHSG